MADRRMFSKRIINSARFLKMPVSTQCLYFHLGLHADDDGIVEAYTMMNVVGATEDDLKILVAKNFVHVLNEDLVTYITDWRENNKLRADRKIDSIYKDLLIQVIPEIEILGKKQRADRPQKLIDDIGTSQGQPMDVIGKVRLGKDSIGKYSIEKEEENESSKIKKEKKNTNIDVLINEYTNNVSLRDTIIDFIKMRKSIKKPLTDRALKLMLTKLDGLANSDKLKIKILEQSILNCWQGIFEIKDYQNQSYTNKRDVKNNDGVKGSSASAFLRSQQDEITDEEFERIKRRNGRV